MSSPVVVGLVSGPVILIPRADIASCDLEALKLALAHEMAHVRRNDSTWVNSKSRADGLLFHPLAWFAARVYALAREEAWMPKRSG